jgi:cell wall-associated NlpC family hydrolase
MLTAACASTGAHPKPFPTPAARVRSLPADQEFAESGDASGSLVVRTAMQFRGVPYRDGGSDPAGFDCSGFTQYVFARAGAALPREVRDQFRAGSPIDRGAQQPGDLVFFATTGSSASHVGIMIGGDGFVHAPSSTGVVRVERLSLPYWSSRLVGIRRIAVADN